MGARAPLIGAARRKRDEVMKQATQRGYDGQITKRWYLHIDGGGRLITWAPDAEAARAKATAHRPELNVITVSPAPSVSDARSAAQRLP